MNAPREILRHLGWQVRMFESELALKTRSLISVMVVAVSIGTAVGYALVGRGRPRWDDEAAEGDDEPDESA